MKSLATFSSIHLTAEVRFLLRVAGRCDRKLTACIAGPTTNVRKSAIVRASRTACSMVPDIPFLLENFGLIIPQQFERSGKPSSK